MHKFSPYILTIFILLLTCMSLPSLANASTLVDGNFVDATYEEVVLEDKTIEKKLTKVTLINDTGKTITLNIDKYTPLFINSTSTTMDAFKEGMWVQATVELRKVKELRGFADIPQGESNAIGEFLTGTVNEIDRNGKFIGINLKNKQTKRFYLDQHTQVFKDTKLVDLSVLFEGDRVKLNLSDYDADTLSSIEVIVEGIQVENLYKGTIQQIDANQKKLVVKEEKVFKNWNWQSSNIANPKAISSRSFTAKTPIFVGNKKIDPSQLRYYVNNEVYYVTISQFGKEVVQKIIIKQSNERTIHENLYSVDTASQKIRLSSTGNISYHNGTIIIRNGRLVDASALTQGGNAYVITNGGTSHQYANIIHMTNDGFQSSSLSNHEIYFGQINSVGSNKLFVTNVNQLSNNYWYSTSLTNLSFSTDTIVVEDYNSATKDFTNSSSKYAYFYVKDNHVVAAHIIGSGSPASFVTVGRYEVNSYSYYNYIDLIDVSQWNNGNWTNVNPLYNLDVSQTTFIKEGKVISASDIKVNNRLYILHDSYLKARIILVD
ncbi:hypothetical protein PGC35_01940 [Psychrobacillus sp. PGGUH221]|uniref:hypothetical protein n=1 Tax=Psychrobacillus sp. PGGUH221 TaxID=3020058 RepID=UPI0035C7767E